MARVCEIAGAIAEVLGLSGWDPSARSYRKFFRSFLRRNSLSLTKPRQVTFNRLASNREEWITIFENGVRELFARYHY